MTTETGWNDLSTYSTVALLAHLDYLRKERTYKEAANLKFEARSYELRIAAAERMLAVHNRRATEAEDQRATGGIQQREVDTLLAVLRHHDEPEAHALVARMWTALQAVQP